MGIFTAEPEPFKYLSIYQSEKSDESWNQKEFSLDGAGQVEIKLSDKHCT